MYVCMYVRMYVCMHACMYVCIPVYLGELRAGGEVGSYPDAEADIPCTKIPAERC